MDRKPTISPASNPADAFAAALAWWREAGIDYAFSDAPADWLPQPDLAAPEAPAALSPPPREAVQAAPPPHRLIADPASLPQSHADFLIWWLSDPALDPGGIMARVPPRGPVGAPLMIIVPQPETEDGEALLSGPQGRLLDAMLAAMGVADDAVYRAAALPRHMPLPDWAGLAAAGLGAVLRQHIMLAQPQRVMILGQAILPLLGHDPAQRPDTVTQIALGDVALPVFASRDLATLAGSARERAAFWRRWLEWTEPADR